MNDPRPVTLDDVQSAPGDVTLLHHDHDKIVRLLTREEIAEMRAYLAERASGGDILAAAPLDILKCVTFLCSCGNPRSEDLGVYEDCHSVDMSAANARKLT